MDVPLMAQVAVSEVLHVDVIADPGANRSMQVPIFENEALRSVL
jgi:hypothetical protein